MKYAVLSDIHGNLEALQAAFDYVDQHNIEKTYCLGDIVGYGPNPNECVELVRQRCEVVLMGNHDFAALDLANIDYFNTYARMATFWTREKLKEENKAYMKELPFTHQTDDVMMVHASPTNPSHWYYILSPHDALIEMHSFNQPICLIGHSHVPVIFTNNGMVRQSKFSFDPDQKYIVNVGSVGQPRDGNPELCFIVVDDEQNTIEYVRKQYEMQETYRKIIRYGLPEFLAERLLKGF